MDYQGSPSIPLGLQAEPTDRNLLTIYRSPTSKESFPPPKFSSSAIVADCTNGVIVNQPFNPSIDSRKPFQFSLQRGRHDCDLLISIQTSSILQLKLAAACSYPAVKKTSCPGIAPHRIPPPENSNPKFTTPQVDHATNWRTFQNLLPRSSAFGSSKHISESHF